MCLEVGEFTVAWWGSGK